MHRLKEILATEGLVAGRIPLTSRWLVECIAAVEARSGARATAHVVRPHEGSLMIFAVAPDTLAGQDAPIVARAMSQSVAEGFALARARVALHSEILRLIRPHYPNTVFAGDVLSAEIFFTI